MSTAPQQLVDYDVEAALDAARETAGDGLLLCVAFTGKEFEPLYVADEVAELYGGEEAMRDHFGDIHSYVHLDFTERDLFEELFIDPDGVNAFVTCMGSMTAVRVLDDRHGIFLGLRPDCPINETVRAVDEAL